MILIIIMKVSILININKTLNLESMQAKENED